jgi:hypothetical protein
MDSNHSRVDHAAPPTVTGANFLQPPVCVIRAATLANTDGKEKIMPAAIYGGRRRKPNNKSKMLRVLGGFTILPRGPTNLQAVIRRRRPLCFVPSPGVAPSFWPGGPQRGGEGRSCQGVLSAFTSRGQVDQRVCYMVAH